MSVRGGGETGVRGDGGGGVGWVIEGVGLILWVEGREILNSFSLKARPERVLL